MPPPESVQRVGRVDELRALGFTVDMRNKTGSRVIDRQMIASRAKLEIEGGELAITDLNIVDATVGVHRKLLGPNRLKIDLVGITAGINVDSLLDVDIGERQIRRARTIEDSQAALNRYVL